MFGLPSLQSMLLSAGIAALVAGIGAGWLVHRIDSAAYVKLQLADAKASQQAMTQYGKDKDAALSKQKELDSASAATEAASIASQQKIVTRTVTLTKEVPIYVTPAQDAAFGTLPCGFVQLHNAAASGEDQPSAASPGSVNSTVPADSACKTTVTLSQAIGIIVSNYGEYHAVSDRLTKWQDWGKTVTMMLDKYNANLAQRSAQ